MSDPAKPDDRRSIYVAFRLYAVVVAAGMEMVVIPLGGFLVDRWWGTFPWLTLAGFVLGFPIGMYHLYMGVKSALKHH
ncbi:MAG: AtpZ/AtpI family protein [Planctomycetes bacterium]|nr:AtpZ/AtpI family protein [Planctomycetota bacterium]